MRIQPKYCRIALIAVVFQSFSAFHAYAQFSFRGATIFSGTGLDHDVHDGLSFSEIDILTSTDDRHNTDFLQKIKEYKVRTLRWQLLPFGESLTRLVRDKMTIFYNEDGTINSELTINHANELLEIEKDKLTTVEGYLTWIKLMIEDIDHALEVLNDDDPETPDIKLIVTMTVAPLSHPDHWDANVYPPTDPTRPSLQNDMYDLFTKSKRGNEARAAFFAAWEMISDHFKNDDRVIAYDLLNEPLEPPLNTGRIIGLSHQSLMSKTVNSLRKKGDKKPIIICVQGGNPRNFKEKNLDAIKDRYGRLDPSVLYDFHIYAYDNLVFEKIGNDEIPKTLRTERHTLQLLQRVSAWQREQQLKGRPGDKNPKIIVGEIGSHMNYNSRKFDDAEVKKFLKLVINYASSNNWSWNYFYFIDDTRHWHNTTPEYLDLLNYIKPGYTQGNLR